MKDWNFVLLFDFAFDGGMRDLIVLIPDHYLSIYLTMYYCCLFPVK